jgi:hypothetical protein
MYLKDLLFNQSQRTVRPMALTSIPNGFSIASSLDIAKIGPRDAFTTQVAANCEKNGCHFCTITMIQKEKVT